MNLRATLRRLRRAAAVATGRDSYFEATVLPMEQTVGLSRERAEARELVKRSGLGLVFTANSRNAAGVASVPWSVMRKVKRGKTSAWDTRPISRKRLEYTRHNAGHWARKAADIADDDLEQVIDLEHPLVKLLTEVNSHNNSFALWETSELQMGIAGNSYWLKCRDGTDWPSELWNLSPQYVTVNPSKERFIDGYTYGRDTTSEVRYDAADVIHFRRPNPGQSVYVGMANLDAVLDEADASGQLALFWLQMLRNGAQPGMVIAGAFNTDVAKQIEAKLTARAGAKNAGKSLAIANVDAKNGLNVVQWKASLDELGGIASWQTFRESIAGAFDMPVALLTLENAALATAAAGIEHWVTYGIRPRLRRAEDTINAELVPDFREALGDDSLFFTFDDPSKEEEDAVANRVTSLFTGNVITRQEARAALALEDIDDGEEVFAADLTTQPDPLGLGSPLLAPRPEPRPEPKPEPAPEPAKAGLNAQQIAQIDTIIGGVISGDRSADLAGLLLGEAFPAMDPAKIAAMVGEAQRLADERAAQEPVEPVSGPPDEGVPTEPPDDETPQTGSTATTEEMDEPVERSLTTDLYIWDHKVCDCEERPPRGHTLKDRQQVNAPRVIVATRGELEAAMRAFFGDLWPRAAEAVQDDGTLAFDIAADPDLRAAFDRAATDPLAQGILAGWNYGVEGLGDRAGNAVTLDSLTDSAAAILEAHRDAVYQGVSDTVSRQINSRLADAVRAGETIGEMRDRIQGMSDLTDYAAERIARTEVSNAYSQGRLGAWRESGTVEKKEWLLAGGPCPMCAAIKAQRGTVGLDDAFANIGESFGGVVVSYATIYAPPAHPNCRCDLVAVFD